MLYEFSDIIDPKELPRKLSDLKWHITGFVDGDGSFPVVLSPDPAKRYGWLIQPRFEIELRKHPDSVIMLKIACRAIGTRSKIFEGDDYVKLMVTNRRLLREKVLTFFEEYRPVLKWDELELMKYVVNELEGKKHLEYEGFKDIIRRIYSLPVDGETRRKWSINDLIRGEKPPVVQRRRPLVFPEGTAAQKHYVIGFIDAEGTLGYAINDETRSITPYLTITHREPEMLSRVQQVIGCGRVSTGRLQVYGVEDVVQKVVPFIDGHKLIARRTVYGEFKRVLAMITKGEHRENFQKVETSARSLNRRLGAPQRPYAGHPSEEG
jgi:hypothetical protein